MFKVHYHKTQKNNGLTCHVCDVCPVDIVLPGGGGTEGIVLLLTLRLGLSLGFGNFVLKMRNLYVIIELMRRHCITPHSYSMAEN